MGEFLGLTISGLSLASIYAIAASGLVVTYTTSGIFNFAHGAVAMISAFVYWDLRFGDGFTSFGVQWMPGGLPAWLSLLLVLCVFAPLLGLAVERVIMRGLRGTSEITQIVVTVALLLLLQGFANWIWPSTQAAPRRNEPFFGSDAKWEVFGAFVTGHQVVIFAVAVIMAVGLRLLLYRTRTGVSMRAVVDDRSLSMLNGGRPDRAAQASWMIGTFLAALAGVLLTSRVSAGVITVLPLTLLVVNAYAAALFGRLRSLPLTCAGAAVIGLASTYWSNYASRIESAFDIDLGYLTNLRPSIPVLVLFVVLLVLPQDRLRGALASRSRERFGVPTLKSAAIWGLVLIGGVVALQNLMLDGPVNNLSTGMALAIIALSVTLLTGYAGEVNLAPMTFAGIGAMVAHQFEVGAGPAGSGTGPWLAALSVGLAVTFASIVLPVFGVRRLRLAASTLGFAAAVMVVMLAADGPAGLAGYLLATLITALVGALVALPALRLRGLYMGLATFAFAVFVSNLVFKQRDSLYFNVPFLGDGEDIEINLFAPSLRARRFTWLGLDERWRFLVLLTVVFAVLGVGLVALRRSHYGRMLTAMNDSPAACATLGLSLARLKLSVFTLSSAIAGLGGALYAAQQRSVVEDNFLIFVSLVLVMLTVVGGTGYVSGALAAGILTGVAFGLVQGTVADAALGYAAVAGVLGWMASFAAHVGPAGVALSIANQPSGICASFIEAYGHLRAAKFRPFIGAVLGIVSVVYALAAAGAIGNWAFAIVLSVAVLSMPRMAMPASGWLWGVGGWCVVLGVVWWNNVPASERAGEFAVWALSAAAVAGMARAVQMRSSEAAPETAPELVGVERPFAVADRVEFDNALKLGDHAWKLADSGPGAGSGAGVGSGVESGPGAGSGAGAKPGSGVESGPGAGSGAGAKPGSGVESGPGAGTESGR